jgi:predicted dehydrogenase
MSIVDDAWRWGSKYPPGFLFWLDVCHWTDLGRWFTGAEIASISCLNPQVEDSFVTMRMTDNSVVSIYLSGNGTMDMIKDELHVTSGARRCASVFDYVQMEVFGGEKREVHTYPGNIQYGGDLTYVKKITEGGLEALRAVRREMYDRFLRMQKSPDPVEEAYWKRNLPNFMRPQGWKESLTYFVESARAGRALTESAGYRDAYIAYQVLEAAKQSVEAGGDFVPVPAIAG